MGQDVDRDKTRRIAGAALMAGVAAVVGAGIWVLFRFVVTDERLVLDYLKALTWPCLIGMMLFWLRAPLRDKFGQLLRLEGFGASAHFSPEAQGERLQAELGPELEDLFAESDSGEHGEAENATPEPEQEPTAGQATPSLAHPDEERARTFADDLMGLVKSLGVPVTERQELRGALEDPDRRYQAIRTLEKHAQTLAKNKALLTSRSEQSRDSIESVIRKSAAWGYEMGKVGSPKAIPDIEWSEDGGWRITTEVPAYRHGPSRRPQAESPEVDRLRQIRSLEDEIKELERKSFSLIGGTAMTYANGPWLGELKRRLAHLDPGNPWSMEGNRGF